MSDIHFPKNGHTLHLHLFRFLFRKLREDNSFRKYDLHFETPNTIGSFHFYTDIFNWDTNNYLNL